MLLPGPHWLKRAQACVHVIKPRTLKKMFFIWLRGAFISLYLYYNSFQYDYYSRRMVYCFKSQTIFWKCSSIRQTCEFLYTIYFFLLYQYVYFHHEYFEICSITIRFFCKFCFCKWRCLLFYAIHNYIMRMKVT